MNIIAVIPRPYEKPILPSINFEIEISHTKYREAILDVNGWLTTGDGKIITSLNENTVEKPGLDEELQAIGTKLDQNIKEGIYRTAVIALLDKRVLNHIEKRRMADENGDIKLSLYLNVKHVENRAMISHLYRD